MLVFGVWVFSIKLLRGSGGVQSGEDNHDEDGEQARQVCERRQNVISPGARVLLQFFWSPNHNDMTTIIGLSGSLRAGSFNTALLRAAAGLMPEGAQLLARTIHGIPLYDGDAEASTGIPSSVGELGEAIAVADGLLLATPEYNNSIPGPFKNAIDWLSRIEDGPRPVFTGKPVAVIGASPGGFGTLLSQNAWLAVLRTLETRPWFGGRLLVSRAAGLFDAEGHLVDESTKKKLREFLAGFIGYVQSLK